MLEEKSTKDDMESIHQVGLLQDDGDGVEGKGKKCQTRGAGAQPSFIKNESWIRTLEVSEAFKSKHRQPDQPPDQTGTPHYSNSPNSVQARLQLY